MGNSLGVGVATCLPDALRLLHDPINCIAKREVIVLAHRARFFAMTFADLAALAVRQLPATTRDSNRHDSSEREAQRLLRKGTFSVSAVAFEVGYESAA